MADIDYPEGLPLPLREGYDINHVDPAIHTPLVSGRTRDRTRFTSVPSRISVIWHMTEPQTALFEGWFASMKEKGGKNGTAWFNCPLRTPLGISDYEAKFIEIYSGPTLIGLTDYRIKAVLQLRERQVVDPDWVEILPEYILHMDIFDIAMNREWPGELKQ